MLTALVGAALLVSACGGAESGGGEEELIRSAISTVAMSSDAADCVRYFTRRWTRQVTKLSVGRLAEMCAQLAALQAPPPRRVIVTNVEVDGDRATAHAGFEGSGNDGQTLEIALVRRDGRWRLDQMLSFVELDRERLVLEQGRELMETAGSAREVQLLACVVDRLDRLDEAQLEELVLSFSAQPMIDLVLACEPRSAAV